MFESKTILQFSDLSAKAAKNQLPNIIGRDLELRRLERVIARQYKRHAVLVGDGGVGKTTLVRAFARRINQAGHPLRQMKLLNLEIHQILIGLMSTDNERYVKETAKAFGQLKNTMVFVDDMSVLLDANPAYLAALTQMFQPFFKLPDLHLIACVNLKHWRQLMERNVVFSRNFELVTVEEPSTNLAKEMVLQAAGNLSKRYNLSVDQTTVKDAVNLAKRYLNTRALPDKAIDLLDEAFAKSALERKQLVSSEDLKRVISERTAIPVDNLTVSDQIKLSRLEDELRRQIVGQDHAIKAVASVIKRSRTGFSDPNRPIGSFLFMGPSGVGKTQLAKTIAKLVYDSEKALIRLDMSEFAESHNVQRLIGAPPGYVGYEEGGQLTNPVLQQPYSLIMLDEIEKAHPKVFDIFLQVLDEGRLTDGQGRTVDFRNTIIIATSNIALEQIVDHFYQKHDVTATDFVATTLMPILMQYFRPEFINRFDSLSVFKPLDKEAISQIVHLELEKMIGRVKNHQVAVKISPQAIANIVEKGYNPTFGARPIKRLIQEKFENFIANQIIEDQLKAGELVEF